MNGPMNEPIYRDYVYEGGTIRVHTRTGVEEWTSRRWKEKPDRRLRGDLKAVFREDASESWSSSPTIR